MLPVPEYAREYARVWFEANMSCFELKMRIAMYAFTKTVEKMMEMSPKNTCELHNCFHIGWD